MDSLVSVGACIVFPFLPTLLQRGKEKKLQSEPDGSLKGVKRGWMQAQSRVRVPMKIYSCSFSSWTWQLVYRCFMFTQEFELVILSYRTAYQFEITVSGILYVIAFLFIMKKSVVLDAKWPQQYIGHSEGR